MERIQLKRFLFSSPMWLLLVTTFCVIAATYIIIWDAVKPGNQTLILHYTIPFGIDLIGPWWWFYVYASISASIALVNTFIAWLLFLKHKSMAYVFVLIACFVSLIVLIALFTILGQNSI